jgi:preprotein translocase subunit SecF
MQMFTLKRAIDFMGHRKITAVVSLLLVLLSIGSLATRGLNFGIDFTGGTLVEVGYPQPVKLEDLRGALADAGFGQAQVQHFGTSTDVLIRIAPQQGKESAQLSEDAMSALRQQDPTVEMRRVEFVGPQIGEELTEQGGLAMIYALIGILIYIIVRFQWRFAPGAVAALVHDVMITLGFFSLFQIDFDLTVLAALLAVINFRRIRKGTSYQVINTSLNQTLSRTLVTSLTTLLVLVSLFLFGGEVIHAFSRRSTWPAPWH